MSERWLIVNADDFGYGAGINRGVIEAFECGIVTSASLMVRAPAVREAAEYARAHPDLSVGLHLDLGEWVFRDDAWEPLYELLPAGAEDEALESEVQAQIRRFHELVGAAPSHLDSHQHIHQSEPLRSALLRAGAELDVPVRHESPHVCYVGDFYGQTGDGEPLPEQVGVEALIGLVREVGPGITEIGCHPGREVEGWTSYREERVAEVETLTDPRVRAALEREEIQLRTFGGLGHLYR